MTTRRQFLRAGLSTLAVGGVALGLRSVDQGVFGVGRGPGYALWDTWDLGGGLEPVIAAAVLAANAHDSQAWRFRVDTDGVAGANGQPRFAVIDVLLDPTRTLGAVDPVLREAHVSLGCAVENLTVVARSLGYRPTVTLLPGPEPDLVARVELEPGQKEPSRLARAVSLRHTNRHPYRLEETIPVDELSVLDGAVSELAEVSVRWLTDSSDMTVFREQTIAATEAFVADPQMSADSHAWSRHDWDELQETGSGLTYDSSLSAVAAAGAKIAPDLGEGVANSGFLAATRTSVGTAPMAGLVIARRSTGAPQTDQRRSWLNAGRLWQRLHLTATTQGIAMQPLNQLAERTDREAQLGIPPQFGDVLDDLAGEGEVVPVMPFRLGYATRTATATPRRPLAEVVDYS